MFKIVALNFAVFAAARSVKYPENKSIVRKQNPTKSLSKLGSVSGASQMRKTNRTAL